MSLGFSICKIKFVFDTENGKPMRSYVKILESLYIILIAEHLVLWDFKNKNFKGKTQFSLMNSTCGMLEGPVGNSQGQTDV